jgi:hypothetical protein
VTVRATQSIGPLNATFDTKVTVLERVPNELIRFQTVGRSVRGAAGNLRSTNAVRLVPSGGGTTVVVDGEVALAGALGSVGQKIVARQAGKVTAEFARNLERSLRGEVLVSGAEANDGGGPSRAGSPVVASPIPRTAIGVASPAAPAPASAMAPPQPAADPVVRLAAVLSCASALLSIVAIVRSLRRGRS